MQPKRKLWVWVDSSNNCNLSCALCYTKASHHNKFLSTDEMEIILEKIFRDESIDVQHFTFNWRGEPLMNKNFPLLLKQLMAEKPNCEVDFHTNATLLTEDRAEAIASVAEDYKIFVSIDGGTRESHEKNRVRETSTNQSLALITCCARGMVTYIPRSVFTRSTSASLNHSMILLSGSLRGGWIIIRKFAPCIRARNWSRCLKMRKSWVAWAATNIKTLN